MTNEKNKRTLKLPKDPKKKGILMQEIAAIEAILNEGKDVYGEIDNYKRITDIMDKSEVKEYHNPSQIQERILKIVYSVAKNSQVEITEKGEKVNLAFFFDKSHNGKDSFANLLAGIGIEREQAAKKMAEYECKNLQDFMEEVTDYMVDSLKQKHYDFNLVFNFDSAHSALEKISEEFDLPFEISNQGMFLGYGEELMKIINKNDPRKTYSDPATNNFIELVKILKKYCKDNSYVKKLLRETSKKYGENRKKFKAWAEKEQDRLDDATKEKVKSEDDFLKYIEAANFRDFSGLYKKLLDETDETIKAASDDALYKK